MLTDSERESPAFVSATRRGLGPDHVRHQRGLTLVDDTGTGLVTEITTEKSGFVTKVNRSLSQRRLF